MIRMMIVDDHDMVRLGLKTYITMEDDMEVVAEASNGLEAIEMLEKAEPGERAELLLLDLMMPQLDGIETTRRIAARFPEIKIIILTSFLEEDKVMRAMEAGAVSYVMKTVSAEELVYAIRGAYRGMPVMNSEVAQALARGIRQRSTEAGSEGFTQREKEVLLLIAEGKSNKDIGEELHISIKTVKTHVSNLLMKCELEDRTQLAIYAHRKGWINRPV